MRPERLPPPLPVGSVAPEDCFPLPSSEEFLAPIRAALAGGQEVLILHRPECRPIPLKVEWFLVRNPSRLLDVLARGQTRSLFHAFLTPQLAHVRTADRALEAETVALARSRRGGALILLTFAENEAAYTHSGLAADLSPGPIVVAPRSDQGIRYIGRWFRQHAGRFVGVGWYPSGFMRPNGPDEVSSYIPDPD